jgi:nucleoside-diphosphate-sugar epimerase
MEEHKKEKEKEREREKARKIVLVTGATGSMGNLVASKLVAKGYEVRVFIRGSTLKLPAGTRPYLGDITLVDDSNRAALVEACRNVDTVYHVAGATYNYLNSYEQLIRANVIGTENILSAYMEANSTSKKKLKFVFTSSVTVYGYDRRGEVLDENSETKPASNYSRSKLMAEQVVSSFGDVNKNLDCYILRLATIYGPLYKDSFFKIFKMVQQGSVRYIGDGSNHLCLIHSDDACDGIILAGEGKPTGIRTYNLTDGSPHTLKSLLELAAHLLEVEAPSKGMHKLIARLSRHIMGINYDEFEFLASDRQISIERIRKELSFRPKVDIKKGAQQLIEEYLAQRRGAA